MVLDTDGSELLLPLPSLQNNSFDFWELLPSTPRKKLLTREDYDGNNRTQLTQQGRFFYEQHPWASDGQKVVFKGPFGLMIVDSNWKNENLIFGKVKSFDWIEDACWSPDAKRIAFIYTGKGETAIYILEVGGETKKLKSFKAKIDNLTWLPDGKHLGYSHLAIDRVENDLAHHKTTRDILIIDTNSAKETKLAESKEFFLKLRFSPDGKRIVLVDTKTDYRSKEWIDSCKISIVDVDGRNLNNLFEIDHKFLSWPLWSPDGKKLAFSLDHKNEHKIYGWIINADGSDKNKQTKFMLWSYENVVIYPHLHWSPDGKKIAWIQNWKDLYVINADGSGKEKIAEGVTQFDWQPITK